jgi:hypothetical protein
MWWILFVVLQFIVIVSGIRQEQRAGLWSWSKFVFAIGFGLLQAGILLAPLYFFGLKNRWFWWAFGAAWVVAIFNFIWMIIVARRWRLPDGRTSLQAYRDVHGKE